MILKALAGVVLMGFALITQAACPTTPGRFVANGDIVIDSKTEVVWARCSVGQSWSGSACTGTASTHSHGEALALAQATVGWRLPNVRELSSIADKGCKNPAIDGDAFPNTPTNLQYWTSSPYVRANSSTWVVFSTNGSAYDYPRYLGGNGVRLVRIIQ